MIVREAESVLKRLVAGYPIISITGPRQSGKTTLAKSFFPEKPYVSLEDPDTRSFALTDPRGFLSQYSSGAIFDEVQRAPDLCSYLQAIADASREMGRFVITGSQQFLLQSQITQSLAGRVGAIELMPFSVSELDGTHAATSEQFQFKGCYPPLFDRDLAPTDWLSDYISTYLERDLRQLLMVKDLTTFRNFLGLVAGRTAQPLNLSALGGDAGVGHHTVKEWLSVLESSYIIKLVHPYYRNFSKRLIKSPMIYFIDTGVLCSLLGMRTFNDLVVHPLKGPVFESFVFSELYKTILNRRDPSKVYFWRDHRGEEVDFVIEQSPSKLHLVECKAGKTISPTFFETLGKVGTLTGDLLSHSFLVYGGDQIQRRADHLVIPWNLIGRTFGEVLDKA
jgi:predicted AAA+ superfamily ATPase